MAYYHKTNIEQMYTFNCKMCKGEIRCICLTGNKIYITDNIYKTFNTSAYHIIINNITKHLCRKCYYKLYK